MRGLDVDLIGFRDLGKDLVRFLETVDDCDDPEADLSSLLASSLGLASLRLKRHKIKCSVKIRCLFFNRT